jgi:transposase
MSHTDISHELLIPRRTVSNFLHRLDERHFADNLSRPGRPRITSEQHDRQLIEASQTYNRLPFAELPAVINSNISASTVRRRLKENGIRRWRALKRPWLTDQHAEKRLKWARAHRHWKREHWRKICFSDECSIEKDKDPRVDWVSRRANQEEKYAPQNVQGKKRDGGVSQMVWGCFLGNKLGPIAFFDGTINSDMYINVLRDNLLSFIDQQSQNHPEIIFQQDNAPIHKSTKTSQWLEDAMKAHPFSLMDWPPNSPDMNPIEHVWPHLKAELHRQYPDTTHLPGGPEAVKRILKVRLMKVWNDIGEDLLNQLIDSMPDRVDALAKANGWYTRF